MNRTFDPGAAAQPGSGIFGLPHQPDTAQVVVLPVPFEATCSYGGGTRQGPAAILEASRQVDLYDVETGRPYEAGMAMLPLSEEVMDWDARARTRAKAVIEAGGLHARNASLASAVEEVNALCEKMNAYVRAQADHWLSRGKLVATLGGDHSVSFGAIAAHAARHPGLGVLHVDAHADLREAYEGFAWSHASIMFNVLTHIHGVSGLVQVGVRDLSEDEHQVAAQSGRVTMHTQAELDWQLHGGAHWRALCQQMVEPLPAHVYLSFDIDGLDPALCPHTGTPVPGGLSFAQANTLCRVLVESGRQVVGVDLTEVAPGDNAWDANVGARLLYKMVGWALASAKR
jgi:agmatinase